MLESSFKIFFKNNLFVLHYTNDILCQESLEYFKLES